MNDTGTNGTRSGRIGRLTAMPVLFRVAAVLVSIAAVVFVVDTLRDDGGAANVATTPADVTDAVDGDSVLTVPGGDGGPLEELLGEGGFGDLLALVLGALTGVFGGDGDFGRFFGGDGDFGRFFGGNGGERFFGGGGGGERFFRGDGGFERFFRGDGGERFFGGRGGVFPPIPREWTPPAEAQGAQIGVSVEETGDGVRVAAVAPGLGAEAAGVEPGDLLLAADGEPIDSVRRLRELVGAAEAGDELTLRVSRAGSERELTVTLSPAAAQGSFGFGFGGEDGLAPFFERLDELDFEDLDLEDLDLAELFGALDGDGDLGGLMEALPRELREQLEELLGEGALPQPSGGAGSSGA